MLVLALSETAWARPVDVSKCIGQFHYLELNRETTNDYMGAVAGGVFNTSAQAGTCWYGGTAWDAVDGRWEAMVNGEWTFDSGVGSVIMSSGTSGADYAGVQGNATPDPNPFKGVVGGVEVGGLHALMEGWVGIDNTFYGELPYLRLLNDADARWTDFGNTDVCVGASHTNAPGVLSGSWSWYCGVFPAEARDLCYADQGPGYGNNWRICMGQTFSSTGGIINLNFNLVNETEQGWDFTTVEIDTSGVGDLVTAAIYDGYVAGAQGLVLQPGVETRSDPGPVTVRFCVTSDGAWSDEDGLSPTVCGAFSIDDIEMTGGISYPLQDFEGGMDGWARLPAEPGIGGEWSRLAHIADLPSFLTPCSCDIMDSVLVFEDLEAGGHGLFQNNLAVSPWIELQPGSDGPGKFIQASIYAEMPLLNYIFARVYTQWFPEKCEVTGADIASPMTWTGYSYYFGGVPQCTVPGGNPSRFDIGWIVPAAATQVRIGVGVASYCMFFANCSQVSNHTPVYDKVSLGVFGAKGAPQIIAQSVTWPQDSFPANGTLRLDAPVRFDAGRVVTSSFPEVNSSIGDTLCVLGAEGGAEVYVNLAVTPDPFINHTELNSFYSRLTFAGTSNGRSFYTARMDTAEGFLGTSVGYWMTAYHEDDPHFSVSDTATHPTEPGSHRLLNDIFPDDLFTPGTRVEIFYRTKFENESVWYILPDTAGGNYIEWEALPSSAHTDSTWNCVLYVNHNDAARPYIEHGLGQALGHGGNNFEGTNWDRYDNIYVVTFGRPLGTTYGASLTQALGYNCIVWGSGSGPSWNLVKEDADILIPYLSLLDFPGSSLYVSGDNVANSITMESASEPSALLLLNNYLGAARRAGCNTYRDLGCPDGASPLDTVACVFLDPVAGTPPAAGRLLGGRSVFHRGQGNGCPEQRSYDVLDLFTPVTGATSMGDEEYSSPLKSASYVSIAADAPGGSGAPTYRTLIDGVSVHHRRDDGTPCDFRTGGTTSIDERIAEALQYLGHGAGATTCTDRTAATGGPGSVVGPAYKTNLAGFSPNPLPAGAKGRITFSMEREGHASIDVFDVAGRLVQTVFDGIAPAGPNEAAWDGTDFTGRNVASGVYFYRLRAASKELSRKLVIVRNDGY